MNRRRPGRVRGARERILAAARRLFATHGIGNVSLRDMMRAAGVNPAALHYHFGSRLALLREIFREARTPLNAERFALLGSSRRAPGQPAALPDVLHAFFWPIFRRLDRKSDAQAAADLAFISQLRLDPSADARAVLAEHERELDEFFHTALQSALPDLDRGTLRLRTYLASSTAWDVVGQADAVEWSAGGVPELYRHFLDFVISGFRQSSAAAPGATSRRPGKNSLPRGVTRGARLKYDRKTTRRASS